MRTRQKQRVVTDTWRSLGYRTTPLDHWCKRKPTVEPRLAKQQTKKSSGFAICEQQRRRSACASTQSDQRLCCSLPGWYNISACHSRNFKTLARLISWAGRFESHLFGNPVDRFSRDETNLLLSRNFLTAISQIRKYVAGSHFLLTCVIVWHLPSFILYFIFHLSFRRDKKSSKTRRAPFDLTETEDTHKFFFQKTLIEQNIPIQSATSGWQSHPAYK